MEKETKLLLLLTAGIGVVGFFSYKIIMRKKYESDCKKIANCYNEVDIENEDDFARCQVLSEMIPAKAGSCIDGIFYKKGESTPYDFEES
jgi:hypothetical protein